MPIKVYPLYHLSEVSVDRCQMTSDEKRGPSLCQLCGYQVLLSIFHEVSLLSLVLIPSFLCHKLTSSEGRLKWPWAAA